MAKVAKKKVVKKTAPKKSKKVTTKLPAKLVKYLDKTGVNHEILEHKTVYTAIDAARTMEKKMEQIAKTLLVKADKDYYIAVLPADNNLDFKKFSQCLIKAGRPAKVIKIPGEKIMENALKIKAGALTAFGTLHKLGVVAEKNLAKAKKAVFSTGSFNHSVEMAFNDFVKMENAILGSIGVKKKIKKQETMKPKRGQGKKAKKVAVKKKK